MAEVSVGEGLRASFGRWRAATALAVLGGLTFSAVPALGQEKTLPGTQTSELCQVFAVEVSDDAPKELRAFCQGRLLMLGSVTAFEATPNETLKATLIDARLGSDRRVLLVAPQDDGTTLVEDLTGQIALEAGHGPMSAIDEVALDLTAFGQTGEIGVQSQAQDRSVARAGRISLTPQIAAERARRSAAAAPVQE